LCGKESRIKVKKREQDHVSFPEYEKYQSLQRGLGKVSPKRMKREPGGARKNSAQNVPPVGKKGENRLVPFFDFRPLPPNEMKDYPTVIGGRKD